MAEALQPLQRVLRSQPQGNAIRPAASTLSQARPVTPQPAAARGMAEPAAAQRSGIQAIPTSLAVRVVDSSSPRVGTTITTGHRHHRTLRGTNSSSSDVLPHRLRLIVHVAVQDVLSAVHGVVIRRSTGAVVLYHLITVVRRLLGIMSATVKPPLA